jgi:ATP-dependent DNA helicase RecG
MSGITEETITAWLSQPEDEHLEFKEATNSFGRDKAGQYCSALSNAGGGYLILGITDRVPRQVLGTRAFNATSLASLKNYLYEQLHSITVEAEIVRYRGKDTVVFSVPPHPSGQVVTFGDIPYTRLGESIRPMPQSCLKTILLEDVTDYSNLEEPGSNLSRDIDTNALEIFRQQWINKSHIEDLANRSAKRLLTDAELIRNGHLTKAALILLGTREAVGQFMPNAEIILEYRSQEGQIDFSDRASYRQGLFGCLSQVEAWLKKRNSVQHFQDGLYMRDIETFDERSMREAIMNAVAHRDYRLPGSIFVRQYPAKLVIESPGGLPVGVTTENILGETVPRNRRIAENLERTGLVERSGQGFDMMYRQAITQSKQLPDLTGTDSYIVRITLDGRVLNPAFLQFLQRLGNNLANSLPLENLRVLSILSSQDPTVPNDLKNRISSLREQGLVEIVGHGRGSHAILSRKLYSAMGQTGKYTRRKGLDKDENKALIMKHVQDSQNGAVIKELEDVLPDKTRPQIHALLRELVQEGKIVHTGNKRSGKWRIKQS